MTFFLKFSRDRPSLPFSTVMDGNHIPDISFANLFNQFFKVSTSILT